MCTDQGEEEKRRTMKTTTLLFSDEMVRAILQDRKTQTRRVLKQVAGMNVTYQGVNALDEHLFYGNIADAAITVPIKYKAGDRILVKETAWLWCEQVPDGKTNGGRNKYRYQVNMNAPVFYAADNPKKPSIAVPSPDTGNKWGWRKKPGRFVPNQLCRITLEVVDENVGRLQDIDFNGCDAEGVNWRGEQGISARQLFKELWESINGAGSWSENPYVRVVDFKRMQPCR